MGKPSTIAPSISACPTCRGASLALDTASHVYRIERATNATRFARDAEDAGVLGASNANPYSVTVENQDPSGQNDIVVTLARARLLVDDEPLVTLGDEQPLPDGG
jgi:hypothetical protein